MDGNVYEWNLTQPEPVLIFAVTAGVTSLRWERKEEPRAIAASTTDGTLAVFKRNPGETNYRAMLAIKAHKPSKEPQNLKFGSLTKFAEIWSLIWSPGNYFHISISNKV
jgi:hypothetical protein